MVGLFMGDYSYTPLWRHHETLVSCAFAAIWLGGGAMIGAGILNLFEMAAAGALIGFLVQAGILLLFLNGLNALSGV